MTARAPVAVLAIGMLLPAGRLPAQIASEISGSARVSWVRARAMTETGQREARGLVLGGEGRFTGGLLSVRLGYAQGSTRQTPSRHLFVEGYGLLGIAPVAGLEVAIGPHIRSRVIDDTRERLVFWRVRVRYEGAVLRPSFRAWVEATAGKPDYTGLGFTRWWGGSAGFVFRPSEGLVGAGVSYAIDEARAGPGDIRETVEALTFMLNIYLR